MLDYKGQAGTDSQVFSFSKGLITEASPLGFPPDSAVDINDFELLIDGTVRRRKGLAAESGGATYNLTGADGQYNFRNTYTGWTRWPTTTGANYIVVRIGYYLHIYEDDTDPLSNNKLAARIDMRPFKAALVLTANILVSKTSFAIANGDLVVSGASFDTFVVRPNSAAATFEAFPVYPVVRCFWDAQDDIQLSHKPCVSNSDYTERHRFNLRVRGWRDYGTNASAAVDEGITRYIFQSDATAAERVAPSKSAIPYKGYYTAAPVAGVITSYNFQAAGVDSNVFGQASAPRGHIKHKTHRPEIAHALLQERHTAAGLAQYTKPLNNFKISGWTDSVGYAWTSGLVITVTLTLNYDISRGGVAGSWPAAGPFAMPQFEIVGSRYSYTSANSPNTTFYGTLDGVYTGTVTAIAAGPPGTTTLTFAYTCPEQFTAFVNRTLDLGTVFTPFTNTHTLASAVYAVGTEANLTRNQDYTAMGTVATRFECNAFFAGRLWLGRLRTGTPKYDALFSDTLLFSKVIQEDVDYNIFHQVNDPTAEFNSSLLPGDGGTIQIPGLGFVQKMVPVGNSLLVFSNRGVWEISGSNGFFAADSISVRKISEVEVNYDSTLNSDLVIPFEETVACVSQRGIYVVTQDENSGFLTLKSLTENTIQTYWNRLSYGTAIKLGQLLYDDTLKRLCFLMYDTNISGSAYVGTTPKNAMLIYDFRLGAFFKYNIPTINGNVLYCGVSLASNDNSSDRKKLKFFTISGADAVGTPVLTICDFNGTGYVDYTALEAIPSITTAYDFNPGDWERKRQALYITTFMKRTETSYLPVTNASSLTLQARWDWTDHTNSGKVDDARQIYRHLRPYTPSGPSDINDGVPIIVTKNKVRGAGRSLHLFFQGASGLDAHLLGWSINYKGNRRL